MNVSDFIAHLLTACRLNGLNPSNTDITFIRDDRLKIIPDDIELFQNELVIYFK